MHAIADSIFCFRTVRELELRFSEQALQSMIDSPSCYPNVHSLLLRTDVDGCDAAHARLDPALPAMLLTDVLKLHPSIRNVEAPGIGCTLSTSLALELRNIIYLDLSHCNLHRPRCLRALAALNPNLAFLDLSYSLCLDGERALDKVEVLAAAPWFGTIAELSLRGVSREYIQGRVSWHETPGSGLARLLGAVSMPRLRKLDISDNNSIGRDRSDNLLEALCIAARSDRLPVLETLIMQRISLFVGSVRRRNITALANLRLPHLRTLDMSRMIMDDKALCYMLRSLAASSPCLKTVALASCHLNDGHELAALLHPSSPLVRGGLLVLDLRNNMLHESGLVWILAASRATGVTVEWRGNEIPCQRSFEKLAERLLQAPM